MSHITPDKCIICHQARHVYPMGEKNGYALEACKACGSVMTTPLVTDEQRETYFGEIDPQITHRPDPRNIIERLKSRLRAVVPHPQGKRFLDVGCQNGYAVVAASELGMRPVGIDQHEFFIEFAQAKYPGNTFETARLRDYAAAHPAEADVIYCAENFCIETDIESFTAGLAAALAPKGIIYIEEPDGNHLNIPRNFANWPVVYPPINFIFLSKRGMAALLKRHGLAICRKFFSWRPFMRLIVTRK